MARRGSSIGFMGRFGRSGDLRQLDGALRTLDLHPALVPEGVKLTIANLLKDHFDADEPPAHAYAPAAALVAYCALGPEAFAAANGADPAAGVERRIEAAIAAGAGHDADLVLLCLHAGLIQPAVVARFDLSVEEG